MLFFFFFFYQHDTLITQLFDSEGKHTFFVKRIRYLVSVLFEMILLLLRMMIVCHELSVILSTNKELPLFAFQNYVNFEKYICQAYDGEPPKACEGQALTISQETNSNQGDQVCHVNAMTSSSATRKKHEMKKESLVQNLIDLFFYPHVLFWWQQ